MRKLLIALIMVFSMSSVCYASVLPPTDKTAHFGVGYIINDQLSRHTHLSFLERTLVVTGIAYAKEKHDTHIDRNDILATIAGGLMYEVRF